MTTSYDFRSAYSAIESEMRSLAEVDGDIFLPNSVPLKQAEYVFVCMEPSLGKWARSIEDAKLKVYGGFQNFAFSIEDFILHFCIRKYLCSSSQSYHLTDLSKGAMSTKKAGIKKFERYDRWYELLLRELCLVAPSARIFAVGKDVAKHLESRAFPRPFTKLIHYSSLAGNARALGIVGREEVFEKFKRSVSLDEILITVQDVLLKSTLSTSLRSETLNRIAKSTLSESRMKLIFIYKCAFEATK